MGTGSYEHCHAHIVVNNTNFITGRTFETEHNQGKKKDRAWAEVRRISDELCTENNLSVIEHPEEVKGKSHWEWDMNRQGLSWKAKLKYAIDQVVKDSDDFADFLLKCAQNDILFYYNPEHTIDLKFMLAEQKERNPRAKMTSENAGLVLRNGADQKPYRSLQKSYGIQPESKDHPCACAGGGKQVYP